MNEMMLKHRFALFIRAIGTARAKAKIGSFAFGGLNAVLAFRKWCG
jgi:hypothetical protein